MYRPFGNIFLSCLLQFLLFGFPYGNIPCAAVINCSTCILISALPSEKVIFEREISYHALNIGVRISKGDLTTMLEQYDDLLSISDTREILNIGRNAVYDLLNRGEISAFRIGRNWKIPKEAVIEYIRQWKTASSVTTHKRGTGAR